MAYFAYEIEEVKSITVNIEAENEQEAYERLFDVDNASDVFAYAIFRAESYDNDTKPMGEVYDEARVNMADVVISDSDYKRIMGE